MAANFITSANYLKWDYTTARLDADERTFAYWINVRSSVLHFEGAYYDIWASSSANTDYPTNTVLSGHIYTEEVTPPSSFHVGFYAKTATTPLQVRTNTNFLMDTWYHIVWRFKRTAVVSYEIYVNGSGPLSLTTVSSPVGAYSAGGRYFRLGNSLLDDCAVHYGAQFGSWSRLLNTNEIGALYRGGRVDHFASHQMLQSIPLEVATGGLPTGFRDLAAGVQVDDYSGGSLIAVNPKTPLFNKPRRVYFVGGGSTAAIFRRRGR